MKKWLVFFMIVLVLGSCLKEPDVESYTLELTVDFGETMPDKEKAGAKVSLLNQLKSYTVDLLTDNEGKVVFSGVEPGFYSATVVHSLTVEGKYYYYNGVKTIDVFSSLSDSIVAEVSESGTFVIKEFYYNGTLTPAGKSYLSDQYIEIYNNTPEVQYADGLSVLEHESYAVGENYWKDISDTVVVKMIWTIPGTGTDVPVQPGQSIVLAQDGINHRDDPNGNPNSPVNLGDADFEFFVFWDTDKDTDSPGVPNLEEDLFVYRGNDVTFNIKGGSGIMLAKLPGNNQSERQAYIDQRMIGKMSASGTIDHYFAKIANHYVIDAVEDIRDESYAIYKRFPASLDAGYTYVPSGLKSGKCIRRKIEEVTNGRVVYQDTNNSTEDFLKDVDPNPKVYEE